MESNYFGHCLAELRRRRRLRQKQVAAAASLDASYIAALENGRRAPPREEVMNKLFQALGLSDTERNELQRTAVLTDVGRVLLHHAQQLTGVGAALAVLEVSINLSQEELGAIETIVDGYRYRAYGKGGTAM